MSYTSIHFDGTVGIVYHLVNGNQYGFEGFISHSVYMELHTVAHIQLIQIFFVGCKLQHRGLLVNHIAHGLTYIEIFSYVHVHVRDIAV